MKIIETSALFIMDWCFMCKSHEERGAHLFFNCVVAQELWSLVKLFVWCFLGNAFVLDLLYCWKDILAREAMGRFGMLLLCV